jgi:hypothetical protein
MTDAHVPLVDINKASQDDLVSVPGIGPGLAEGIIANRPYKSLGDLVKVSGINDNKLATIMPYITLAVKTSKPIPPQASQRPVIERAEHVANLGGTETFVFLEDRNERQDALLIIFGGFILGLIILMLRRSNH